MRTKLPAVAVLISLAACHAPEKTKSDVILDAIKKLPKFTLNTQTRALIVIADNSCIPCNQKLTDLTTTYINKPDVQFIVSAHESRIDISGLTVSSFPNIYIDKEHMLTNKAVVAGSTVLLLSDNASKIDTSITISEEILPAQLDYIRSKLGV